MSEPTKTAEEIRNELAAKRKEVAALEKSHRDALNREVQERTQARNAAPRRPFSTIAGQRF